MNKEIIFNHFSDIIDNMLETSLFFDTYFQAPYMLETICGSADDPAVPEDISLHFGITRGCIVDDNFDYVVKFDIDNDFFGDSLCYREMDIYRAAESQHLEHYFTKPIFVGVYHKIINFYDIKKIEQNFDWVDYDNQWFDEEFAKKEDDFGEIIPITIEIPLYAYPKANPYTYTNLTGNEAIEYEKKAKSIGSPLKNRHLQIAMEFILRYGMEEYEKISEFMYEYNINDLHYGNIGEINNKLVVIDFAGFHSSYSDSCDEE
jgi:hypothetical protein